MTAITLTTSQAKVLRAFKDHGELTDFELGYAYRLSFGCLDQSWSGLRTRRAELVKKGYLTRVARRKESGQKRASGVYGIPKARP